MTPRPQHTICFDFPEMDGETWFAAHLGTPPALGLTTSLEIAARFDDEASAQRTLENGYGKSVAKYGVVVELNQAAP